MISCTITWVWPIDKMPCVGIRRWWISLKCLRPWRGWNERAALLLEVSGWWMINNEIGKNAEDSSYSWALSQDSWYLLRFWRAPLTSQNHRNHWFWLSAPWDFGRWSAKAANALAWDPRYGWSENYDRSQLSRVECSRGMIVHHRGVAHSACDAV